MNIRITNLAGREIAVIPIPPACPEAEREDFALYAYSKANGYKDNTEAVEKRFIAPDRLVLSFLP